MSAGTAAGTGPVVDLWPGPRGSNPAGLAAAGRYLVFAADDEGPPPDATPIAAPELGGFRLWVRITAHGEVQPARREPCIPETVCVSGAVPGRSELFVRIVGPKPNGRLWPTLVRFSTSTLEVWIEQISTGILRHYRLEGATRGSSELDGLFDRDGFPPG